MNLNLNETRQAIYDAFHDVERGEVTLHEAEAIDSYVSEARRDKARKRDLDLRWQDIPADHIMRCPNALPHLDPVSFRFYIARFMVWTLNHYTRDKTMVSDHTIYAFCLHSDAEINRYMHRRFATLSEPQRDAVCAFLRLMADAPMHVDARVAQRALDMHSPPPAPAG